MSQDVRGLFFYAQRGKRRMQKEEHMKIVCLIGLSISFVLAGCGLSIRETQIENGRVVSRTEGGVGWNSADIVSERSNSLMESCLAKVGALPNANAICKADVQREIARQGRALEMYSNPYVYTPYGYGGYPYYQNPYPYGYGR
jgi:hypothetical protein